MHLLCNSGAKPIHSSGGSQEQLCCTVQTHFKVYQVLKKRKTTRPGNSAANALSHCTIVG